MPITVQQDATIYSVFISVNRSTCFGWYLHPSSGAHITVSTVAGISKTVTATCRERDWTGIEFPSNHVHSMQWTENEERCLRNCQQHNQHRVSRTRKKWSFFFVGLLLCEKFDARKVKCNLPDQFVHKLGRIFGGEFGSALVKNELMLIYG